MPGVLPLNPFPNLPYDAELDSFSYVTGVGSQKTSDSQRLIGTNFEGNALDAVNWTKTELNGGTVVLANFGYARLNTSVAVNGSSTVSSFNAAEFLSGSINDYITGIRLSAGVASNIRRWGVFDAQNGLFFELNGVTLRVVSRKNGVDTAVASGSFNGTLGTTYVLDTNFHVFDIFYSAGSANFLIDRKLLHKLTASADTYIAVTSLKIGYENTNTGSTTNSTLDVRGNAVSRLGHLPGTPANPMNVFIVGAPTTAIQTVRFGRVSTGASAIVRVMDTSYTQPTSAVQRSVASSSASDTAAGTGAQTLKIIYYDNTMLGPFEVILTLNGVTPVNTGVTDIRFIQKMEVVSVGSGGTNAGTITLFGSTGGGGGTVGTIATGASQTFWAHHYVKVGNNMSLRSFYAGSRGGGTGGNFSMRKINPLLANDIEIQITEDIRTDASSSSIQRSYDGPIRVIGPARVSAFIDPDAAAATDWFASFDIVEMPV